VAGHIPGALCRPFVDNLDDAGCFLPAETLRNQFLSLGLNDGAKVTCYCGSGVTATVNMIALLLAGFGEPALYAGSFSDWITHPQHPIGRANDQLSR
jgi:thiosulfate/3-mercaptopyruvate sulfurtransferase